MNVTFDFDLGQQVYVLTSNKRITTGKITSVNYLKKVVSDFEKGPVVVEYKTYAIDDKYNHRFDEDKIFKTLETAAQSLLPDNIVGGDDERNSEEYKAWRAERMKQFSDLTSRKAHS